MKALRIILASIKKADIDFNLFKEGSKICIGISGGKDSMALFYALNIYKKYSKTKFEIYPMIIDLGFDNFDAALLKNYIHSLGYELYVEGAKSVYQILKIQQEKQHLSHLPCSICSKMKKAIINKVAKKIGCDYVSFAHHKNDLIETLFLNEIYGGRIATFSPKMFLTNEKITFIRPFIYVNEKDIKRLIKEENIPVFPSNCPNDHKTERENIKNILSLIEEKYPSTKDNFLTMLLNESKQDILYQHLEHKIEGSNYFYKEITTINDLIEETNFLRTKKINKNKNLKHYLLYKNKKIYGVFYVLKNDKMFTIYLLKFINYSDLDIIIGDIYSTLYYKYNPFKFYLKMNKKIRNNLKIIPYKILDNNLLEIDINPSHLNKLFRF